MPIMEKSPAEIVIEKFGGHAAVAELLKVDVSRIYRWTYPRKKGGTDGLVPQKHQAPLMAKAREKQIDLRPADFFPGHSLSGSTQTEGQAA